MSGSFNGVVRFGMLFVGFGCFVGCVCLWCWIGDYL